MDPIKLPLMHIKSNNNNKIPKILIPEDGKECYFTSTSTTCTSISLIFVICNTWYTQEKGKSSNLQLHYQFLYLIPKKEKSLSAKSK